MKILQCIEYGKAFICASYRCRHERNETGEKLSVYTQCIKAFAYGRHLQRNERTCIGKKP